MKKRLLSLVLALVLVAGLFAGLAAPVSANDDIGQLFDRYLTGEKIDELFDETQIVHSGFCGKGGEPNVQFRIYRVDPDKVRSLKVDTSVVEQNQYYQQQLKKETL